MQFFMNFHDLWVVLIPYYKCMHLIIHFNLGDPAVSSHLFPFSVIQHYHRKACCQQQYRCLTAAHNQ
jgi:hypothetical protein